MIKLKKIKYLYVMLMMLSFSCSRAFDSDNVIDRKTFVQIVTEFYLYKNYNPSIVNGQALKYNEMEAYVLINYKVTPKQFKDSYGYYLLDERESKKIIKKVEKNLKKYIPDFDTRFPKAEKTDKKP